MNTSILLRRGSAKEWIFKNPTLEEGELGFEIDTGKLKIGDGVTSWRNLNYISLDGGEISAQ